MTQQFVDAVMWQSSKTRPFRIPEFASGTTRKERAVALSGIVLSQSRPGWVALELPPLEIREQEFRWLTQQQRERITSLYFCEQMGDSLGDKWITKTLR